MSDDPKLPVSFSETEAQRILARAAELEASIGNRFSTEDLRQIALKAGIDAYALERAIHETGTVMAAQPIRNEPPPLMTPGRIATLAATGAVLGALAIAADNAFPGSSAIPVFLPSALFAFYLTLRHPVREGFLGLFRELGVTFGAFTATIMATGGLEGASIGVTWSLLVGSVASGILALRGARPAPVADAVPFDSR
jgi:hypothetical protein